MEYSIGVFSRLTNIGIHALRYYEKEQLMLPARKDNGRRVYTDSDIRWIEFIKRLKDTGMTIKDIQKYAQLRAQGDGTMVDRMDMLTKHREAVKAEIAKWEEHLEKLENKIDFYQQTMERQNGNVD